MIGPSTYSADYYGVGVGMPLANYHGYGPGSMPHWSRPLAALLRQNGPAPLLDLGAAYGHLARDYGSQAVACEWSAWATAHGVSRMMVRADGRKLPFRSRAFGTVTSLDFLEHLPCDDVLGCIEEIARVLRPGGLTAHLLGVPDADGGGNHYDDPTHQCHEGLAWYSALFAGCGLMEDGAFVQMLNDEPAWSRTDWRGRWIAFRKPAFGRRLGR